MQSHAKAPGVHKHRPEQVCFSSGCPLHFNALVLSTQWKGLGILADVKKLQALLSAPTQTHVFSDLTHIMRVDAKSPSTQH